MNDEKTRLVVSLGALVVALFLTAGGSVWAFTSVEPHGGAVVIGTLFAVLAVSILVGIVLWWRAFGAALTGRNHRGLPTR